MIFISVLSHKWQVFQRREGEGEVVAQKKSIRKDFSFKTPQIVSKSLPFQQWLFNVYRVTDLSPNYVLLFEIKLFTFKITSKNYPTQNLVKIQINTIKFFCYVPDTHTKKKKKQESTSVLHVPWPCSDKNTSDRFMFEFHFWDRYRKNEILEWIKKNFIIYESCMIHLSAFTWQTYSINVYTNPVDKCTFLLLNCTQSC